MMKEQMDFYCLIGFLSISEYNDYIHLYRSSNEFNNEKGTTE
jgi:hypothetical protein